MYVLPILPQLMQYLVTWIQLFVNFQSRKPANRDMEWHAKYVPNSSKESPRSSLRTFTPRRNTSCFWPTKNLSSIWHRLCKLDFLIPMKRRTPNRLSWLLRFLISWPIIPRSFAWICFRWGLLIFLSKSYRFWIINPKIQVVFLLPQLTTK
jgi:hypothetical protein